MSHSAEKHAGVMGWPVKHSLSPRLHGYWIKEYGISASYDLLPVAPENLEHALGSLLLNGYAGCNLTLPHKEKALPLVDRLTPAAAAIGAVNTVVVEPDGRLLGDNTDVYGFLQSLKHQHPSWQSDNIKNALVIGAGGAACAIIYGLVQAGVKQITIANRSLDKAGKLAEKFATSDTVITTLPLAALAETGAPYDLVVNASVLGMTGQPALDIDLSGLAPKALVSDIVYTPRLTPLLQQAKDQGFYIAEGIDMLLHQAAPGFEYWFGLRPKVTPALKKLITEELQT